MASVQKTIAQPQFPFVNFAIPKADTTKARQVSLVGGLAREAVKAKASVDLVGGEVTDDVAPVETKNDVGTSGFTEIVDNTEEDTTVFSEAKRYTPKEKRSAYNDAINDPDLNLRKVAAMRKQGRLSASGAKALVNKSVQEASARLPGSASEFRQKAAAFFGDFGEAGGVLKNTFQEDLQEKMQQKVAIDAISNGFGFQDPQSGQIYQTQDQIDLYMRTKQTNFMAEAELKRYSVDVARGTRAVNTFVSKVGNTTFANGMNITLAAISSDLSSGKDLKPEDIQLYTQRLYANETTAMLAIDSQVNSLRANGQSISPSDVKGIKQNIKDEIKRTRDFLTSTSFSELTKQNKELMADGLAVDGYKAFGEIAALRAVGGDSFVKFSLEILPKLEKMTDTKRQIRLGIKPDEEYLWNRRHFFNGLRKARGALEAGIIPEDKFVRGLVLEDARNSLVEKDTAIRPQSINAIISARKELGAGTYEAFTNPKFAEVATPNDITSMSNLIVSEMGTSEKLLVRELKDNPQLEIRYFPSNRKTPFSIQLKEGQKKVRVREGAGFNEFNSRQLASEITPIMADSILALNNGHNIYRNFSRHPRFVADFGNDGVDTFFAKSFSSIQKGIARPTNVISGKEDITKTTPTKAPEAKAIPVETKKKLEQLKPGVYQDENGDYFRITTDGDIKRLDDNA